PLGDKTPLGSAAASAAPVAAVGSLCRHATRPSTKLNSSWTCPSRPRYNTCNVLSADEKNPLGAAAAAGAPVSAVRSRCRHVLSPPKKKEKTHGWTPPPPQNNNPHVVFANENNPLRAAA